MQQFAFVHLDPSIWGSIIGSFIAVCGAITVLFLSEWWRNKVIRKQTSENFVRELVYLKEIIKECRKSLNQMIEQLSVGATAIYFNYNSSNLLSQSSQKAYQEGMLYELLKPSQIARFNSDVLTFFGTGNYPIENYVRDQIKDWNAGNITMQDLYGTLVWVKEKADDAIKLLNEIHTTFVQKTS